MKGRCEAVPSSGGGAPGMRRWGCVITLGRSARLACDGPEPEAEQVATRHHSPAPGGEKRERRRGGGGRERGEEAVVDEG